jgi:hypothetical protein
MTRGEVTGPCRVGETRAAPDPDPVCVHSDRSGELAERVGDAPMGARINPEFV